jgi:CCR4-NOT transcription complex subunit 2
LIIISDDGKKKKMKREKKMGEGANFLFFSQVMANLNFQQPPRSIQSSALSGRSTGFGNSSLSGHVTPTSGMFPPGSGATGNASYGQQQQQQQLSPNRNVHLGGVAVGSGGGSVVVGVPGGGVVSANNNVGVVPAQISNRTSMFGGSGSAGVSTQRGRPMNSALVGSGSGSSSNSGGVGGGPMSNMASFMQSRGYGSQTTGGNSINNFHSVFGNSTSSDTPPLLDLSEFPSLTNARGGGQNDQTIPQPNPLQPPGSKPYGGYFLINRNGKYKKQLCILKTKIIFYLFSLYIYIFLFNDSCIFL